MKLVCLLLVLLFVNITASGIRVIRSTEPYFAIVFTNVQITDTVKLSFLTSWGIKMSVNDSVKYIEITDTSHYQPDQPTKVEFEIGVPEKNNDENSSSPIDNGIKMTCNDSFIKSHFIMIDKISLIM